MTEDFTQNTDIANKILVGKGVDAGLILGDDEKKLPIEEDYRMLYMNAMHLYDERNYEDASKAFLELYEKFPDQIENLINCGNCYYELLNAEEAVKYWEMAKEKDKYLINSYINLGNYYLANENFEKAADEYTHSFCLNPQNEMSTVNLAITYEKMNDKRNAFLLYEFFLQGNLNVSSNTYKSIDKKVALHKLNAISHMKLGIFFEKKGYLRKALQSYYDSVKIFPNFAKTYSNIGNIFFKLGKFEYAKMYWLESYKIDKKNVNLYLNLAVCCEKLGDLINTYAFYSKFIQHAQSSATDIQLAQTALIDVRNQIIANPDISKKYLEDCEKLVKEKKLEDALLGYENLSLLSTKKELQAKINDLKKNSNIVHKASYLSFEMAKDLFEKGKYEFAMDKCKLAKSLWEDSYYEQSIKSLMSRCRTAMDTSISNMMRAKNEILD